METETIETIGDLDRAVKSLASGKTGRPFFRGVGNLSYSLKPKVGRLPDYSSVREASLFRQFKERCILHANAFPWPPADDWDWLPIAQHYGLATRLLDWTKSPLVAAFFAVEDEEKSDQDAAVYAFHPDRIISKDSDREKSITPFNLPVEMPWMVLVPAHFSARIAVQEGVFTLHREPCKSFIVSGMLQIIIKAEARKNLRTDLYRMGVHRAALFPDIDNLCRHLNSWWSTLA